jgi:hypothetical protein
VQSLCIGAGREDRETKPDLSQWEPGTRELVIDLAKRLEIASNSADAATWFGANDALNT